MSPEGVADADRDLALVTQGSAWQERSSRDQANAENSRHERSPTSTRGLVVSAIRAQPTPPAEPRTAFASRRSPVRSRLAPLEKCLLIGRFW